MPTALVQPWQKPLIASGNAELICGSFSLFFPSTCWESYAFKPCVLPEPGRRSIAPGRRWLMQFPRPCRGSRTFFITFPYAVYTIMAARFCVLHEKLQWEKRWSRDQPLLTFCVKTKMSSDSRSLSDIRRCIWSWGPCTLATPPLMLLKEISVLSEYSHIWILFWVLAVHFHKADFASSCLEVSVWSVLILPLPSDNLSWLTAASRFPENCRGQMG